MLEYAALALTLTMMTFIIYLVIYIHDIPYEIAKKRDHPHQDAIHVAGWVSLFLLHTIWPLLWIWAYLYTPGKKFMQFEVADARSREQGEKIAQLEQRIESMTAMLSELKATSAKDMAKEDQNG
jgi:hypothetical protein